MLLNMVIWMGKGQGFMQDKMIASHTCFGGSWMLTVKPFYKLSDVPDYLKWATNTRDTLCTHFQGITNNIYGFRRILLLFTHPSPVHPYFYPSISIFTHPNDGWTGLYIKLWEGQMSMLRKRDGVNYTDPERQYIKWDTAVTDINNSP